MDVDAQITDVNCFTCHLAEELLLEIDHDELFLGDAHDDLLEVLLFEFLCLIVNVYSSSFALSFFLILLAFS